jgi:prolipoprotein diacylglyceryltransferase
MLAIWEGGIGVWGGILGGFLGGVASAVVMNRVRAAKRPRLERAVRRAETDEERLEAEEELALNQPMQIGVIADLTVPALLLAQTIGRIGDIINGEHCAKALDFFLAFSWTNPESDARICDNGVGVAVHPAIAYEMIWNMIALAVLWKLRNRLIPPGMVWAAYLVFYSVGRFAVSFSREDDVWALGMQEAHYIALLVVAITVPVIIVKGRLASAAETASPSKPKGTRAERRRRTR